MKSTYDSPKYLVGD